MRIGSRKWAFTLIELLVVVATIALLLSILLPSLAGAREQGKRARCLANLSGIGKAVYQYATEDRVEQIVPIHMNMVRTCQFWEWRCVNWFAWGGRSGQRTFVTRPNGDGLWLSAEDRPPGERGALRPEYDARRRPLNRYILTGVDAAAAKKMEWFMCPSDQGYPDDPRIDDSPGYNSKRLCYDTLGNSYRASLCMFGLTGGSTAPSSGHFSLGPWGHRVSTLTELSRTVLFGEPSWFNMIGQDTGDPGQPLVPVLGWHKKVLVDNLIFCDGSARSVRVQEPEKFGPNAAQELGLDERSGGTGLLEHRSGTYKLDCYPVGGAIIWGDWSKYINEAPDKWPWRGYQDNLRR